jgi:hypothetical protein
MTRRDGIKIHRAVELFESDAIVLRQAGLSESLCERFAAVRRWDAMGLTSAEKWAEYRKHFEFVKAK